MATYTVRLGSRAGLHDTPASAGDIITIEENTE